MNVIYKIIFILGVLFVCSCKQDGEQSTEVIKQDGEQPKQDISGDFTEAYIVLLNSYNRFKSLINGPKGFSNSFFDDMKRLFNADVEQYAQNDFYASLGFDAVAIDNLKHIITTFNLNKYYYDTEVGNSFVHRLRQFILKLIVLINNLLQKNDNIGVLKDSNNMEGLKELASMLDDVCVKWGMFVGQVKNAINEASNLTVKNAVINKLEIVSRLEIDNPNQICVDAQGIKNELCDLKHELLQLFISIKDKVLELVKDVGKE
ncbi:hypothetical protein BDCR2A_01126 [Borrelia duttonii CR2A]|uniref:Lipoprotein n=1 Tax=Borrelia duttonii CR2A TaxID=1432657 RepID=W6TXQ1_9SPIR|nr:hypothetical protein [Borrelia duttonii]ETZ17931.1 hypothetical protein BDCR2A_01126 [Borrelia duttonii CR2A]